MCRGRKMKWLVVVMTLGCMLSALSGCGKAKENEAEKKEDAKTIITLGHYAQGDMSGLFYHFVEQFNKVNDRYQIEVKDYSKNLDIDKAFNLDVAAGNMPDIIVTDWDRMDKLIYTGLLTDMQTYLDNDNELDQEDFLDSVMSAWLADGGLYYVSTDYMINFMYGKETVLGQYHDGWTKQDMIDFAESSDEPLFYDNSRSALFDNFLLGGYSEFVDWNTGKAKFESTLFRRILEYCDQQGGSTQRLLSGETWDSEFKNNQYRLNIFQMSQFFEIEEITRRFGTDICCIGYANAYRDLASMQFVSCIGISSQSKYQDVVWQYVRSLLTKEGQYDWSALFPVRKDVFAMRKREAMATETYTDEYGKEIDPFTSRSDSMIYTSLTQEEADLVEKLVLGAKHCRKVDHKIESIVTDEVSAYFNGDCTIDRVGETINSRVETYMNENR